VIDEVKSLAVRSPGAGRIVAFMGSFPEVPGFLELWASAQETFCYMQKAAPRSSGATIGHRRLLNATAELESISFTHEESEIAYRAVQGSRR
jgi:hypothetical protein